MQENPDFDLQNSPIYRWFVDRGECWEDARTNKMETVENDDKFEEVVLASFDPYFEPYKDCARKLRVLLFGPAPDRNLGDTVGDMKLYKESVEERDETRFFAEYRRILQEAYDKFSKRPTTSSPTSASSAKFRDGAKGRRDKIDAQAPKSVEPDHAQDASELNHEGGLMEAAPRKATRPSPAKDRGYPDMANPAIDLKRKLGPSEDGKNGFARRPAKRNGGDILAERRNELGV